MSKFTVFLIVAFVSISSAWCYSLSSAEEQPTKQLQLAVNDKKHEIAVTTASEVTWAEPSLIIGAIFGQIGKSLVDTALAPVRGVWNVVQPIISVVSVPIKGIWNFIKPVVNVILAPIRGIFNLISTIMSTVFNVIILPVFRFVKSIICTVFSKVKGIFQSIGNFFKGFFGL